MQSCTYKQACLVIIKKKKKKTSISRCALHTTKRNLNINILKSQVNNDPQGPQLLIDAYIVILMFNLQWLKSRTMVKRSWHRKKLKKLLKNQTYIQTNTNNNYMNN